ncbi:alpha/beta fold hydrolase [Planococcus salinarum]|uniref:alpha/beta fold hydrolase n=1 Tax=Planococcus salinarum TaxID=622695 RepID=UPI000E3D5607|nr:alpha/beta fold hydrolase [Planococcus salinarum]TAA72674.1 alpha/beta fold hydrolase [Planococcus salinarum]
MADQYTRINPEEHRLNLNTVGKGEKIVFLHGGPGSEHRFFLPHVLPLAQNFKLIFYDQTGCGKSAESIDGKYSMQDEVYTLERLRQELKLEKLNLYGESWGSMLALLYATTYPERVNKIFLTAAIGATAEGFKTFGEELEKSLSNEDKVKLSVLEERVARGSATVNEVFDILDKYYVYSEESLQRKEKTTINTLVNGAISEDILANYNLTNELAKIRHIPIVIVQGVYDILTPELIKELLIKHIPHTKLVEVENCGHWTVIEKPYEMNKIANDFFGSNSLE